MILRYIFAHLLFFVTGVGVTVLLMNLLIGILSALMVRIGGALSGTQLYQREILNFHNRKMISVVHEIGFQPIRFLFWVVGILYARVMDGNLFLQH